MTSSTIRFATLADIPIIRDIATRSWAVAYREILPSEQMAFDLEREYSDEALKRQMQEEKHVFWLLSTGQPVGFASLSAKTAEIAKLHKLYVTPETKGQGYGARLMEAVIDYSRIQGFQELQLLVNRSNPAVGFYQRQGFSRIRDVDTCIGEHYWRHDYLMAKSL